MLNGKDEVRAGDYSAEVLTGTGERRRWSAADKARVVADSFAPGVGASEAARRWQVSWRQIYTWRGEAQAGLLPLLPDLLPLSPERSGVSPPEPAFVPIVAEPALIATPSPAHLAVAPASACVPVIEVEIAGAVVRVPPGLDDGLLARVLRAVRASAVGA